LDGDGAPPQEAERSPAAEAETAVEAPATEVAE